MPIMLGFSSQRKQMLEAELRRFIDEMPQLGMVRMWVVGDLARGTVTHESELELVLVQATGQPWHRRSAFWTSHLRPRVGVTFNVFTPEEFEQFQDSDPVLAAARESGGPVYG